MIPQYSHNLLTSFILWLDNKICNEAKGYQNVTGSLYKTTETSVNGNVYASPFRTWVYDSCVDGAAIPSGFYTSSGNFLTRESGVVIDFINGRVITPHDWGSSISGIYSRKEVNIYLSNDEETNYILEQVYGENKNLSYELTGLNGKNLVAPLMLVTNAQGHNTPWALGGTDNTQNTLRAISITNSNYLQEGVNSFCKDLAHSNFPLASYADAPIRASGDLKTVPWSYCTGIKDLYGCGNGVYIENVYEIKLSSTNNKNKTFFISALEFDVSKPR